MRGDATTEQDTTPGLIPSAPWRVSAVEVLPAYKLKVRFIDGTEGTVDMSRLIFDPGAGVFASLRDPAAFSQAYVESGAVSWPGEINLAPDAMHQEIRKNGEWLL
jgi:CubicO group peptidase (beta-lactamase class C family)